MQTSIAKVPFHQRLYLSCSPKGNVTSGGRQDLSPWRKTKARLKNGQGKSLPTSARTHHLKYHPAFVRTEIVSENEGETKNETKNGQGENKKSIYGEMDHRLPNKCTD